MYGVVQHILKPLLLATLWMTQSVGIGSASTQSPDAIDRLDEISAAWRAYEGEDRFGDKDGPQISQLWCNGCWNDWNNWFNWGDWNDWPNWGNWVNW